MVKNALLGNPLSAPIPNELLPWDLGVFLLEAWLPLILMAVGAARRTAPVWLLAYQAGLLVLSLRSMRFIEYWAPLVALSAGPTVDYLQPSGARFQRWIVLILFITARPAMGVAAVLNAGREQLHKVEECRPAAEWLRDHAGGSIVFNAEWDAYPLLRWYGGTLKAVQGLDPVFAAAYDPDRYRLIRAAEEGRLGSAELPRAFAAAFVVARTRAPIARALRREGAPEVYQDHHVAVFKTTEADS